VFLISLVAPALSQEEIDINALIEEFVGSPMAAMDKLVDLAKTNPDAVALVLAGVAEKVVDLRAADPGLAASLEDALRLTCVALMDVSPSAAALVVVTIKDRVPDIGERVEQVLVAAGLEERYLRAASPVRP